jgi:hypothetical protein
MPPPQTLRHDAQQHRKPQRDRPQREVVGVEKDEFERVPRGGEVVVRDAEGDC